MASGADSLETRVGAPGLGVCGVLAVCCGSVCACRRAMAMPPYQPLSAPKPTAAAPHLLSSRPRLAVGAEFDYFETCFALSLTN